MRSIPVLAGLLLMVWVGMIGCGGRQGGVVLATVGEHVVTVEDLRAFVDGLLPGLKTKKEGLEGKRDYLQTMIDRQLLLVEARARGLDRTAEFIEDSRRAVQGILAREYERREITIELTEEEIRQYFEEECLGRQLRISYIRVRRKEEAEAIAEELRKGRHFEDLAREHSLDMASGPKGGDLGFFTKARARSRLIPGDFFFSMQVGDISDPYSTKFGYQIIKITEEKPADLESQRGGIVGALRKRRFLDRKAELVEELGGRFKLRLHPEGLGLLLKKNIRGLSEEQKKTPLYTFEGGEVTIGDYIYAFFEVMQRPAVGDSACVVWAARQVVLPKALMTEAAHHMGLHREPTIASRLQKKEEESLLTSLRKVELADGQNIGEEEIRAFYDEHPHRFMLGPEVTVREILVRTEEEARRLLNESRQGADMAELAERHTLRRTRWGKGEIHIHLGMDDVKYGPLAKDCQDARVGEFRGPIEVEGVYSIYKVLDRIEERPEPFETAKRRARAYLRIGRENELFSQLLRRLREKYSPEIVTYEENLKKVSIGV